MACDCHETIYPPQTQNHHHLLLLSQFWQRALEIHGSQREAGPWILAAGTSGRGAKDLGAKGHVRQWRERPQTEGKYFLHAGA